MKDYNKAIESAHEWKNAYEKLNNKLNLVYLLVKILIKK